jgi:tetratricopeptide (TPR) repeat protein
MSRLLFCLVLFLFCGNSFAAEVAFKNGKKLNLDIVSQEGNSLKAKTFGVAVKYDLSDVSQINGMDPKAFLDELAKSSYSGVKNFYQQGINSFLEGDLIKARDYFNQGSGYDVYGFDFKSAIRILDDISGAKITLECSRAIFKGLNLSLNGQYGEAVKEYQTALKSNSDYFLSYKFLGFCYYSLKQYKEAVEFLNDFLKRQSDDPESAYYLGASYAALGQNKDAVIWFNKAVDLNTSYIAAYMGLGDVYLAMDKPQFALPYFQRASRYDIKNAQAYFKIGVTYSLLGQSNESRDYLMKAKDIYKENGDTEGIKNIQGYIDKSF